MLESIQIFSELSVSLFVPFKGFIEVSAFRKFAGSEIFFCMKCPAMEVLV
jgi:hypothetical protein